MDMSSTIAPKSNQLNADDLIAGPRTIKVTAVRGNEGNQEQPVAVSFEGDGGKPYLPCKSMRRVMVQVWGADARAYVGRAMTLYRDPEVIWGGMKVGGIRISHMSDMDGAVTMALTATKQQRKPYTVKPLVMPAAQQPATKAAGELVRVVASPSPSAMDIARAAAMKGAASFRAWYNTDEGKDCRAAGLDMEVLKAVCERADEVMKQDPFNLPPVDMPSAEELARAEAEALAAANAQGVGA
jgi:hypothetical protein